MGGEVLGLSAPPTIKASCLAVAPLLEGVPETVPVELRELWGLDPRDVLAIVLQEAVPALLVAAEA
eukprot:10773300-Alexandrium_andersonii.AAC.1